MSEAAEALERAAEALARRRTEVALGALLDAWRAVRDPRLADLVDQVSARIEREPVPGKRMRDIEASWSTIEAARDPADLERLLAAPLPGRWVDAQQRLERLAKWPADPRLAAGLVGMLRQPKFTSMGSMPFWSKLLGVLVAVGDRRALDPLRQIDANAFYWSSAYQRMFSGAADRLASKEEARLAGPEEERLAAIGRSLAPVAQRQAQTERTETDFLAAIREHPEQDDARLVYADWLTERDDPRGEFIALQCERALKGGRVSRREAALLKAHGEAWCGPLAAALRPEGRVFERGFLAAGIGRWDRAAQLKPLVGAEDWATVVSLTGPSRLGLPATLVAHPVMRALREADNVLPHEALVLDAGRPLALEGLSLLHGEAAGLGAGPGLPSVRRLHAYLYASGSIGWLWDSPIVGRLETLSIAAYYPLVHLGGHLETLLPRLPANVRSLRLMSSDTRWPSRPEGWTVTLVRQPDGRFSELRALFGAHQHYGFHIIGRYLAEGLAQLRPDALTRLVIEPSRAMKPSEADRAALQAAVDRFTGLEHLSLDWE